MPPGPTSTPTPAEAGCGTVAMPTRARADAPTRNDNVLSMLMLRCCFCIVGQRQQTRLVPDWSPSHYFYNDGLGFSESERTTFSAQAVSVGQERSLKRSVFLRLLLWCCAWG